ncbi:hypothetical protein F5148DRAFT_257443 [Russula earlei]|uniref:Uncharacterized protein n=1 Tax=Russula earlei TaxID=71964 RepID=A0ACC0TQ35_9AGAM|nr:hypothetical protein F5148DRAFT_257443 [Russula earlei]
MHRLTVLAFALLLTFASVFPSVLARETNAYRLKRGYPPLPPTRREVGKRSQPSPSAVAHVANTVSGVLEVRDSSGAHHIGFVENVSNRLPDLGVTTGSKSSGLQATFSWQDKTVVATVRGKHILFDLY